MRVNKFQFNITKTIAGIILIVAWSKGEVSGLLAWVLLMMLIDIQFEWNR